MKITILLLLVLLSGCFYGKIDENHNFRPRIVWYSMDENDFVPHPLIDTNFFYVKNEKFLNYDGRLLMTYYGFLSEGKAIKLVISDTPEDEKYLFNSNTWETAQYRGYYTTKGDRLIFELFESIDHGSYIKREAIIKKDTLIIETKAWVPFKYLVGYTTLVKTEYRIGKGE